ncbi:uncharacterized protein LOC143151613 [Ptiloglossa arizonensis]|uniref:uncharacterized protein LOC143151613 n=1 Tax=Ptiloglossa arizonensis TaxID=3350558 RepID=UPI003F9EC118
MSRAGVLVADPNAHPFRSAISSDYQYTARRGNSHCYVANVRDQALELVHLLQTGQPDLLPRPGHGEVAAISGSSSRESLDVNSTATLRCFFPNTVHVPTETSVPRQHLY